MGQSEGRANTNGKEKSAAKDSIKAGDRRAPAHFVSIPLGRRLKGRKGMFRRRRNQQEQAQEKGSQEPGVVPWQEAAFKLVVFELVSIGIPLLLLRLINKLLTRSS